MRSPNQHPDEKPVGAAEGCDLLLWIFKIKKIAAFGSSYNCTGWYSTYLNCTGFGFSGAETTKPVVVSHDGFRLCNSGCWRWV
jgi:hypothetical protein